MQEGNGHSGTLSCRPKGGPWFVTVTVKHLGLENAGSFNHALGHHGPRDTRVRRRSAAHAQAFPATLRFPAGQSLAFSDPSGQYLPAGHGLGADDPSGQKDPAGHSTDAVGVGQ